MLHWQGDFVQLDRGHFNAVLLREPGDFGSPVLLRDTTCLHSTILPMHNSKALPILQCLQTLRFIHLNPSRMRQHLRTFTWIFEAFHHELVKGRSVYLLMASIMLSHSSSASLFGSMDFAPSFSSFVMAVRMKSACASMIVGPFDSAVGAVVSQHQALVVRWQTYHEGCRP